MVLEVVSHHCCGQDWNFSLKLSGHHKYAKKPLQASGGACGIKSYLLRVC